MRLWLGTHHPNWLDRTDTGWFVSRRRLVGRRSLPRAIGSWALDSGGFTELSMFGAWETAPQVYVGDVRRFRDEIGQLAWAAPQDWMCEPWIIAKTGLSITEHQQRTISNLLELRILAPDLPFVPVLQGWTLDEYLCHADAYDAAGIDLTTEPLVAVGSVCRRQQTQGGREIIIALSSMGLRLHAFGLKQTGLREIGHLLVSSDSMAWSYNARRSPPMPGCHHRSCANCMKYALAWHQQVLERIQWQQGILPYPCT